jgi:hypothetical protein
MGLLIVWEPCAFLISFRDRDQSVCSSPPIWMENYRRTEHRLSKNLARFEFHSVIVISPCLVFHLFGWKSTDGLSTDCREPCVLWISFHDRNQSVCSCTPIWMENYRRTEHRLSENLARFEFDSVIVISPSVVFHLVGWKTTDGLSTDCLRTLRVLNFIPWSWSVCL